MIIGLSGTNSSGKDTVANYLESIGYTVVSLSDILREEMKKREMEITRDTMITTAGVLENELGAGALVRIALETHGDKNELVLSSVRKPPEIDLLKKQPGFSLVFVDAPIEVRYSRILKRKREGEQSMTLEAFRKQEEIEMSGESSQNLTYCKEKADYLIENNGNLEDLYRKTHTVIEKAEHKG